MRLLIPCLHSPISIRDGFLHAYLSSILLPHCRCLVVVLYLICRVNSTKVSSTGVSDCCVVGRFFEFSHKSAGLIEIANIFSALYEVVLGIKEELKRYYYRNDF